MTDIFDNILGFLVDIEFELGHDELEIAVSFVQVVCLLDVIFVSPGILQFCVILLILRTFIMLLFQPY